MINQAIKQLLEFKNLDSDIATSVMNEIMNGDVDEVKIATFLTALRMKGETPAEITEFVKVLRSKALPMPIEENVIDIVGTGGDGANTFNISTTTSFVVAACGAKVAKHGNRSVSSRSGAADVLEALGININTASDTHNILAETGLTFMFAPLFHSSMKYVASARKKMGIRTVFNILGPLINPVHAQYQLMGVFDSKLVEPLAEVLNNLNIKRALVVHGNDGLDEATLTDFTHICEIKDGKLNSYQLDPRKFGFSLCDPSDLVGGNALENSIITRNILSGVEKGPKRDIVILNSALALYIYLDVTIEEGISLATKAIDQGFALEKLEKFIKITTEM
ncbi:MAG: anthranilate phosphoribosyltransferase [Candidatus Epulonipiscioides saccharophilum]|nr:MAG: anthranilate phosphoribosyltransferase [Epulopiscium sp. AS2M-Bin001]